MKPSLVLSAVISLAAISFIPSKTVQASSFEEQQLNQDRFVVVAAPYRHGYNLLVIEQIPGQKKCWSEMGHSPTIIKPLFLDFDFTNACKRSADSNSYSIRLNDRDYGMDYLTDIVEQDGELHLIGVPRDSNQPQFHIGRTYGLNSGSLKIVLDPEWRLTKRLHENKTTDHLYLSKNLAESEKLVSHAVEPATSTQRNHNLVPNPIPVAQPIAPNLNHQPSTLSNYQQPVYHQPVYSQPMVVPPARQSTNVYSPQPVYYPVPVQSAPPAPQQLTNVYSQPVYQQPQNTGYRQY